MTHAYATSIHKAQGSDYPIVIIPMLGCFKRMLRRNILYTGITRAIKEVIIVGSKAATAQAIHNNNTAKRNTRFAFRLRLLMKNPGRIYSSAQIYELVWKEDSLGAETSVSVHIRHLRQKLDINPSEPRYLKVVWGLGYKMEDKK
mgnify:CR=1 FL=1